MSGGTETAAPFELFRVRHMFTALYVARTLRHARSDADLVDGVNLFLDLQANAAVFDRTKAERVANAWIALTGDHGIEIEPTEG